MKKYYNINPFYLSGSMILAAGIFIVFKSIIFSSYSTEILNLQLLWWNENWASGIVIFLCVFVGSFLIYKGHNK